jgi:signal transduction histidine kinase
VDAEIEDLARISVFEERLSVLRHDLRNRLSGIRNGAFYLRRRSEKSPLWEEDPRFPKFFDLIESEIEAAEKLLADQASTAELVCRRLEPQLLEKGVRRGLAATEIPAGLALQTDFSQVDPTPVWDLEIALLTVCLASNAVEAMAGCDAPHLRITTGSHDGRARLRVEDTGPGIAREAMAGAMQAFRSEKPGHAGVGLNVARRIVQRYGGEMELQASEGGGLAVDVALP